VECVWRGRVGYTLLGLLYRLDNCNVTNRHVFCTQDWRFKQEMGGRPRNGGLVG
jgi:hypothetical protein